MFYSLIIQFVSSLKKENKLRKAIVVLCTSSIMALLAIIGISTATTASAATSLPKACQGTPGKLICASKSQRRVFLVKNGVIKRSAPARFGGRASDGSGPWYTREGRFSILYKDIGAISTLYRVKMPFFMAFSGGQGLHYSSEFAGGYPYSHGCIGLKSWAFARKAFRWAPVGTPFVVTRY